MIEEVARSAVAPFLDPTGWQAFAYGLLGLRAIGRAKEIVTEVATDGSE